MASSLRNLLICVLGLTASQALAAQGASSDCRDPVVLDSGPFVLDHKTNLINVQNPKITQCKTVITADEAVATGLDFDTRSEWRFKGHVHVVVDNTYELTADTAVFTFADKRLARGQLLGICDDFLRHVTHRSVHFLRIGLRPRTSRRPRAGRRR